MYARFDVSPRGKKKPNSFCDMNESAHRRGEGGVKCLLSDLIVDLSYESKEAGKVGSYVSIVALGTRMHGEPGMKDPASQDLGSHGPPRP